MAKGRTVSATELTDIDKRALKICEENRHELSQNFPKENEIGNLILCPLCLSPLYTPPANLDLPEREELFQPPWRKSKREEGEAESSIFYKME
ncbi:MAG: hypothetical protein QXY76_03210 [Nitrososphaeria archaeon]